MAFLVSAGAQSRAEIPNGHFEQEEKGMLAGWIPQGTITTAIPNNVNGTGSGFTDYIWDTEAADGGKGSLLIRGKGIRVSEAAETRIADSVDRVVSMKVPVRGGQEYRLTFFYKAEGLQPDGRERCEASVGVFFAGGASFQPGFLNAIGVMPDRWSAGTPIPGKPDDQPVKPNTQDFKILENAAAWRKLEFLVKTPPDATKMDIRPTVNCTMPAHPFAVSFDAFTLEPVSGEPVAPQDGPAWVPRSLPPRTGRGLETGDPELLPPAIPYGSRIQRTMKLLATSTPDRRNRVHILCYGQSIIAQSWWYKILANLKVRFPHADIVMENRALGGFMSPNLVLTAEADLYPVWPDLVLMHDYVGDGEHGRAAMDHIFGSLAARTTSEMLVYTFHSSFPGTYQAPNMFNGYARRHDADSAFLHGLADKYGYEVVDARKNWEKITREVLPDLDYRFAVNWFLFEQIHTNPRGQHLYHYLTMPHFAHDPGAKPDWLDTIKVYTPDGQRWPQEQDEYPTGDTEITGPLKFEFDGSRIDLIAGRVKGGKSGSATILIDGKPPTRIPGLCLATRTSPKPPQPWPMIKRIQVSPDAVPEDWTLTLTRVTPTKSKPDLAKPDGFDAAFDVTGSVTGPDGSGDRKSRFVSDSGRITIEPEWHLDDSFLAGFVPPVGYQITWKTIAVALDEWRPKEGVDPATEDRYTLAQGLPAGKHTLEIIPKGDGPLSIRGLVVYKPDGVQPPYPAKPADPASR